jgi:hypothetical protein
MASENTKAILVTGSGGAVAVTQFIAVKQLVDKTTSVKPLGSFSSTMFKGLNEWTTMASLLGGVASLGYVIYQMEKGKPLSDLSLTLGSYGVTSLVAGIINAILDPLGTTGATINLSNLFKGLSSGVSKTLGISTRCPSPWILRVDWAWIQSCLWMMCRQLPLSMVSVVFHKLFTYPWFSRPYCILFWCYNGYAIYSTLRLSIRLSIRL